MSVSAGSSSLSSVAVSVTVPKIWPLVMVTEAGERL